MGENMSITARYNEKKIKNIKYYRFIDFPNMKN